MKRSSEIVEKRLNDLIAYRARFSMIDRIMSGAMLAKAVQSKGFGHQIPDPPQHTLRALDRFLLLFLGIGAFDRPRQVRR